MHEFEEFEASKFVSRLLGKGDWKGFIDKVQVRGLHPGITPLMPCRTLHLNFMALRWYPALYKALVAARELQEP